MSGPPNQDGRSKSSVVVVLHLWMRRGELSRHRSFGATPQTSRADGVGPHRQLAEFAHHFLKDACGDGDGGSLETYEHMVNEAVALPLHPLPFPVERHDFHATGK